MRAGSDGCERIGDGEATIVVPMPVDANFFAGRLHHLVDDKLNEIKRAVGGGVADGVAENDGARAVSNGRRVQPLDGIRIGSNRVFRDVHGRKPVLHREPHGFFGGALEMINRPVFHEAADRAGSEERCCFNGNAHHL